MIPRLEHTCLLIAETVQGYFIYTICHQELVGSQLQADLQRRLWLWPCVCYIIVLYKIRYLTVENGIIMSSN